MNIFLTVLGVVVGSILLVSIIKGFVIVKEGTAKNVVRLGSYFQTILAKQGYVVAKTTGTYVNREGKNVSHDKWDFIRGKGKSSGLRWIGPWPVYQIMKMDNRWVKVTANGGFEPRNEVVDFVLAKVDYQYGLVVEPAEDKELLPLSVSVIVTARIVNAYKVQFCVRDWYYAMTSRLIPYIREDISNYTYESIIQDDNFSKKIKERISRQEGGKDSIIKQLRDEYGIDIRQVEISKIDPYQGPIGEFRRATLQSWQAKRDAEKRSGSTIGAIVAGIAALSGKTPQEIQGEFDYDREKALLKYEKEIAMNKDFILRKIAVDGGSFFYDGPDGIGSIMAAIAAFQKLGGNSSSPKESPEEEREKSAKELAQKLGK